jgi:hypothetical protein
MQHAEHAVVLQLWQTEAPSYPRPSQIGSLVEIIATLMSISRGTTASRVRNPRIANKPQTLSTTPTNGAISLGRGIPIEVNRPAPSSSGHRNFRIPSTRKTQPTSLARARLADGPSILRRRGCGSESVHAPGRSTPGESCRQAESVFDPSAVSPSPPASIRPAPALLHVVSDPFRYSLAAKHAWLLSFEPSEVSLAVVDSR